MVRRVPDGQPNPVLLLLILAYHALSDAGPTVRVIS